MNPTISVIICTRNRADSLERTLEVLKALEVSELPPIELVIVDNASSDRTPEVILAMPTGPFLSVVRVLEPQLGLSFARNTGIKACRGELVIFTDDDCYVSADWVRQAWFLFKGNFRQLIAGQVLPHNHKHLRISIRIGNSPERLVDPSQVFGFLLGANMAFGRQVFDEVGLFDTAFGAGSRLCAGEDTDFVYRAYTKGIPVRYEPSLCVHHDHGRTTPKELSYLTWGYAVGTGALVVKHTLNGRVDLLKPLYWDFRSTLLNFVTQVSSWRHLVARGGFLLGGVRYMNIFLRGQRAL